MAPTVQDAEALLRSGELAKAFACFEEIIASHPDDETVRSAFGIALAGNGRVQEALEQFRRAELIAPGAAQSRNVGVALMTLGDAEQAIEAFRRAIEADAHYPDAHRLLAEALGAMGRTGDSDTAFHNWLRLQPDQPAAMLDYARHLRTDGRFAESAVFLEQVIRSSSGSSLAELHRELGLARLQGGDLAGAGEALEQALSADPGDVHSHAYLAVVHERQGHRAEAIMQYEQALLLHRSRPRRWPDGVPREVARLGLLYEAAAHKRKAMQDDRVLPIPGNGKLLTVLVGCYGSYPEYSIRCLRSVLDAITRSADCDLLIGLNACGEETIRAADDAVRCGAATGLVRSTRNLNKDPMMRLLLEQVQTPYVLWLDDDSHFTDPNWSQELNRFIRGEHPFDVAGQRARWGPRRFQDPSYMTYIGERPWWKSNGHLPADLWEWCPFAVGGLFVARTNYLRIHDYPDRGMTKALDDVVLGELLLQRGGRLVDLPPSLLSIARISDGHRRGENFDLPPSV
ncbi:tetratricopeptide repeat protein [Humisphaera borealis]|uniref:Tetratricopeptide repeat protein n=1 Tax=Humisphaera borealis TaxID=2807512 RepID=A0A7M2WR89_9BACT|nr:tetratricopeptide repeat protein [Humisphaera borealis]QOV87943.1 tetratricopeptide repeat protein [Humisphaera borealis]